MERQEVVEASRPSRLKMQPEKLAPESYREYLDMDTDEEEFGRQETPEPQDEAPLEPDKPEFTNDELDILVEHTKSLTVLADLAESDWTSASMETIREYFLEPSNTSLTISFVDNELRALLGFPRRMDRSRGLAYFLRTEPWQVYRADDFLATVCFGSVDESIERTLLKLIDGIYAPLVFRYEQWPEIMRDDVFSRLNDFLTRANDLTYSPMGILMLYAPWEGRRESNRRVEAYESVERSQRDQESLIDRLEKVARTWIKQIRGALLIKIVMAGELYDVDSEFEFWRSRYENLTGILKQLSSNRVKSIVKQLRGVKSPSVRNLKQLTRKVEDALKQAESNLMFLDLLLDSCKSLSDPKKIQEFLPKILHVIRFSWAESSYYNEPENIERLLCSLSVQIVKMCIDSIDLRLIFDDPKKCRQTLKTSLSCCDSYSKIYDNTITSCMEDESKWKTDKQVVFNCVNLFEQRCRDVIEICDANIIYGSLNKINLGGTHGNQHEMQYRCVKDCFVEMTNEMRVACNCALDIRKIKWFDDMSAFRRDVAQLENTIKNLLNSLFEDVKDIEMGIETLYTLLKFKDRRGFRDILHDKWTQVWKIFYEDIKIGSAASIPYEVVQDNIKLQESESDVEKTINKHYLSRLHKMMIDASDWLGDCDIQYEVLKYLNTK